MTRHFHEGKFSMGGQTGQGLQPAEFSKLSIGMLLATDYCDPPVQSVNGAGRHQAICNA